MKSRQIYLPYENTEPYLRVLQACILGWKGNSSSNSLLIDSPRSPFLTIKVGFLTALLEATTILFNDPFSLLTQIEFLSLYLKPLLKHIFLSFQSSSTGGITYEK